MLYQHGEGAEQGKPDHEGTEQRQNSRPPGDEAPGGRESWDHPGCGQIACRSGASHQDEVVPPEAWNALNTSAGNVLAGVSALVAPVKTGGVSG